MILTLDTVSPLPEFSLIEDNKIIFTKKIIENTSQKMSDSIIEKYQKLENEYLIEKKIKSLVVNTGPGSYTALRIGISFLSGLSISKNLSLIGIPCISLFSYEVLSSNLISTAYLIYSSNKQKYICIYDPIKKFHKINKISTNKDLTILNKKKINKILTNTNMEKEELDFFGNMKIEKIFFRDLMLKNIEKIMKIKKQDIISPIYISNNKILN